MSSLNPEVRNQVWSREDVIEELQALLEGILRLGDLQSLTPDARLQEDLGIGSLDVLDLVMAVEKRFSIKLRSVNFMEIDTIEKIADLILEQMELCR